MLKYFDQSIVAWPAEMVFAFLYHRTSTEQEALCVLGLRVEEPIPCNSSQALLESLRLNLFGRAS
jgi:hypothetical protein